ncbi:hypothetical protein CSAL01_02186 [Colletotrichum salicis]|uniref:Uncharacterized protein n=1 Tax=Colletotrichum salicis TaxID=1209931 RepID=A0A135UU13_9PEZI|nr:hypothetical protein CSAL01_02186 [Colletotrichum salicis]
MQTTLLRLLNELSLVVAKRNEIVQGSRLPLEEALARDSGEALEDFSDSDSSGSGNLDNVFSTRTESGHNATETDHIMLSLMKASFKIRQPASRAAQLRHKALDHKVLIRIDDTSTGELMAAYSDFDRLHVKEMFRKFRKHTIGMDTKSDFRVSQRLGESGHYRDKLDRQLIDRWSKSITNRRRYFSYWKRHASKLSRAAPPEREGAKLIPPRQSSTIIEQPDTRHLAAIFPSGGFSELKAICQKKKITRNLP